MSEICRPDTGEVIQVVAYQRCQQRAFLRIWWPQIFEYLVDHERVIEIDAMAWLTMIRYNQMGEPDHDFTVQDSASIVFPMDRTVTLSAVCPITAIPQFLGKSGGYLCDLGHAL